MKLTKTKIKAILLAKELMEKQDKFILDNNLNNIPINEDFTNFISSNYKNFPTAMIIEKIT